MDARGCFTLAIFRGDLSWHFHFELELELERRWQSWMGICINLVTSSAISFCDREVEGSRKSGGWGVSIPGTGIWIFESRGDGLFSQILRRP
jgi:hypothetical protein